MTESNGDEFDDFSAMELWLHDLSVDSATRVAGGLMILRQPARAAAWNSTNLD